MNDRRINSNVIVPHMSRPPQPTLHLRVPAARLSRDPRHDVTGHPATVSGRRYNAEDRRTNVLAERAGTQPVISACWTARFDGEGTGCRRKPLCNARWPSKIRNDGVRVSLPVANGRRNFTQPIGGKEFPVNAAAGRAGRQKISCDQFLVSRGIPCRPIIAKPGVKSHNLRNERSSGPEAETSKTQKNAESCAAAENEFIAVGDDCSATLSSRGSSTTSITWHAVDDVRQLRGKSARTSGVFSRMSTEAQQAWIAVRRSETSAVAFNDEPETKSSAHAGDTTSGLAVRQSTTRNRTTPRDSRGGRHGAKYATQETAYKVFEPRSNGRIDGASNVRIVNVSQHRGGSRNNSHEVGSFRITPASYDSRFVDMALEAKQRVTQQRVTSDTSNDDDDDDNNDDDDAKDIRAASVAKCLSWLRTQHFSPI